MNTMAETGIIIAVVTLAAAFVVLRVVRTFRDKRPSCCSGGGKVPVKGSCPHCRKADQDTAQS
jgi:tRNA(Ile2) C34 agmatinyltransferase TiaS